MQIKLQIKSVYGKELVYPACKHSMILSGLAKTKTFSALDLESLELLGFTFKYVNAYSPIQSQVNQ